MPCFPKLISKFAHYSFTVYAIVDIETTGGHAASHGITEVAIVVHDGSKIVGQYESLINPGLPIPNFITSLTGISNAMVASAPRFEEVAGEIHRMLEGNVFVAHNVNFDHTFLRAHLSQCGYSLSEKKLCTVRLTRKVFPHLPSYSLGNLCRELDIPIYNRHRAGGDATATAHLFDMILRNGGETHIREMLKKHSGEHWLPVNLNKSDIENLPSCPGVYYFHDEKERVIYVGKAINLKKRVTSHFTGFDPGNRRMQFLRKIHSVKFKACASELHALVLESVEIKRLWPRYNYSQKQASPRFGLFAFEDNRGFLRLAIDHKKKHQTALYQFNLLHEGRTMLRKMVKEYALDEGMCFLSNSSVVHDELDAGMYNSRVERAIRALERKLPTFVITSRGHDGRSICLLMYKGCYYGMGYVDELPDDVNVLRDMLEPQDDNDYIRNSLFRFAELHPALVHHYTTGEAES